MRPPATLAQLPTTYEPSQCMGHAWGKAACSSLLGLPQRLTLHEGVQGVIGPLISQHAHVVEVVLHVLRRVVFPPPGRWLCRAAGGPRSAGQTHSQSSRCAQNGCKKCVARGSLGRPAAAPCRATTSGANRYSPRTGFGVPVDCAPRLLVWAMPQLGLKRFQAMTTSQLSRAETHK